MDEPVRFIGLIQVGITVFAILIGAVGEPLLSDFFEPPLSAGIAFAIAFAILTYLSVVLGELVPKAVALQRAERLAVVLSVPLDLMARSRARSSGFSRSPRTRAPCAPGEAGACGDDRVHA